MEMCGANVGLMKELVVLRAEHAALLGFESHAEYVSPHKSRKFGRKKY